MLIYTAIFRKDRTAGFIVIAYLAQLLPWLLVPRLIFAYHYFPCVIFLVLSLAYVFKIIRLESKHWKVSIGSFLLVSILLFVMFYPALSGMRVNNANATKLLGWLPTWPF